MRHSIPTLVTLTLASRALAIAVPSTTPSNAANVDPELLGVSLEFFTFPAYTEIPATINCLANIQTFRGVAPPVRIGGTTQDRATYNPSLSSAVNYTVASSADAPTSLTYGPSFFTLAAGMKGDVTIGLNRQLNNQANSLQAAQQAKSVMGNLYAFELGNEPDLWGTETVATDATSETSWFKAMSSSLGNVFQAGVYLSWKISDLIPDLISDGGTSFVKSFSRHSYPQSACNGASTSLPTLMSHSGIVSYLSQFKSEATLAHTNNKKYFLGETNSGGGISPTFGAALWIVDYVLQAAWIGVDRLYFHQGTIGNCQYCWWGRFSTGAPYYGAAFVAEFLGTDGTKISMLDDGTSAIGVYAIFNSANKPVRLLVYNSNYFDGTGTRSSTSVSLTGLTATTAKGKRFTSASAPSRVDGGVIPTIGGGSFSTTCTHNGTTTTDSLTLSGGGLSVAVQASEAYMVFLS
ncbi:hypothetical protein PUNSTDRAFT_121271 [Punctularia strigosozonata HHB-11173 SS5]|uniref:uncharacterized protein n=1 Tax=Punctularia strigosozonata (strain HHB-11173) TaxID=741275 RepID=UPI0004417E9B|nr:uncharacterized protein PUNSTDRAFT_121271 [Punctularia strigosozonata HHB-11173 SS5]EIN07042.1 hypothetical protein PUNSTDRAFT_121271 [Punctularia strigosozonata HHB-11173 SS5]